MLFPDKSSPDASFLQRRCFIPARKCVLSCCSNGVVWRSGDVHLIVFRVVVACRLPARRSH